MSLVDWLREQDYPEWIDGKLVYCHETHDTKTVDSIQGPFVVYDWEQYWGYDGYCPGADDVSRTIDLYGYWETGEWERCMEVIRPGDVVWDFGSQIGWYSKGVLARGGDVWAVDSDEENMRLLESNIDKQIEGGSYLTLQEVGELPAEPVTEVRLVKADVEGGENEVLRICRPSLQARTIDYLFVECSPEFDSYYPALIDEIREYGYRAYIGEDEITGGDLGATQKNVWFQ